MDAQCQATRFVHSSRDLLASGEVKPAAFEPGRDGTTSVAEITGQPGHKIWCMARHTLNQSVGRSKVLARADFQVSSALALGLTAFRDDNPFVGHAYLTGWGDDFNERRARWKAIALDLCDAATVVRPPSPITLAL